jgi:hypothetical protein
MEKYGYWTIRPKLNHTCYHNKCNIKDGELLHWEELTDCAWCGNAHSHTICEECTKKGITWDTVVDLDIRVDGGL